MTDEAKGVDHLLYTVPDLEPAMARLERELGVRPAIGGRHPDLGTRNALLALGPATYLEVLGPDLEWTGPPEDRPFGISELTGARLATWSARHPDLEAAVETARSLGVELGDPAAGSRDTPDGRTLRWRFTDPFADRLGGVVPFLIDWGGTPHPAGSAPKGVRLLELMARHPRPDRVRRILAALGVAATVQSGPEPTLSARLETPEGRTVLT